MKAVIVTIVCSLMILSCEVDDSTIDSSDLYYPMHEGNVWKYLQTIQYENIVGDSLPITVSEPIYPSYAGVWVDESQIIKDKIKTMVVKAMVTIGETELTFSSGGSEVYYSQDKEGLYIHAYNPVGLGDGLIPKEVQKYQLHFNSRIYESIDELIAEMHPENPLCLAKTTDDSLIYEDPPVCVLKYPLTFGSQWTYRNSPWRIDKVVEDEIPITTAGKTFKCFKIRWYYDRNGDNDWDDHTIFIDYVSEQGLIMREKSFIHVIIADMGGNEIGSFDMHMKLVLQDYNLHTN